MSKNDKKEVFLVNTNKLRVNNIRKQYYNKFVDTNLYILESIYKQIILNDPEIKYTLSLEDWINFAFNNTSTDGLKLYK